jgi:hypothetical protein
MGHTHASFIVMASDLEAIQIQEATYLVQQIKYIAHGLVTSTEVSLFIYFEEINFVQASRDECILLGLRYICVFDLFVCCWLPIAFLLQVKHKVHAEVCSHHCIIISIYQGYLPVEVERE